MADSRRKGWNPQSSGTSTETSRGGGCTEAQTATEYRKSPASAPFDRSALILENKAQHLYKQDHHE